MTQAEQTFVGQLLLDSSIAWSTSVNERHLRSPNSVRVLRAVRELAGQNIEVNMVAVKEHDKTIDTSFLSEVASSAPSAANWEFYEERILEDHRRRRLYEMLVQARESLEADGNSGDVLRNLESGLVRLNEEIGDRGIFEVGRNLLDYLETIEARVKQQGEIPGIETGIWPLSEALMGLQPERLYYIGARPSVGKSALLLNFALHIATEERHPVGFLSLESGRGEIMDRIHSAESGIDSRALVYGMLTDAHYKSLSDAQQRIHGASPILVYDEPNMSLGQLVSQARRMVRAHGVKVLFVDYLQIIAAPGRDKRERVEAASLGLKQLARELKVPVVAAAQLRRESDTWWPDLGDFQHSSQAEQDGDACVFIGQRQEELLGGEVEERHQLVVAKNRDGRSGFAIPVEFEKKTLRFREVRRDND